MATPCIFFARGSCNRGKDCKFLHDQSEHSIFQKRKLRGDATTFDPSSRHDRIRCSIPTAPEGTQTSPICHFYTQGRCKNGDHCRFRHETPAKEVETIDVGPVQEQHQIDVDRVPKTTPLLQLDDESRDLRGAFVTFRDGADVVSVTVTTASSGPSERSQLNTVSCSWYKPSRVAWLQYYRSKSAEWASKRFGEKGKINGRVIQAKVIEPPDHPVRRPIWSVELGNLSIDTSEDDLKAGLKGIIPDMIVFGKSSYNKSEEDISSLVKSELLKHGSLETFEMSHTISATRMKALARFKEASHARAAVELLSGTKLPLVPSVKLFVNLIASVKFIVLRGLFDIIADGVKELQQSTNSVRINVYHPEREGKPVIVRIVGDDIKTVSKIKVAFESHIKGVVLRDNDGTPCWDNFFTSTDGFSYLRGLNQPHRLFVYRDMRNCRLVGHGSEELVEAAREAVTAKVKGLSELTHSILLTPDMLQRARNGGFRRMAQVLGKHTVKSSFMKSAPSITICGNLLDAERAKALLLSESSDQSAIPEPTSAECPACMTEPERPLLLACGHSYCGDCFESQCEAAEGATIPLVCFGNEGKCDRVITLEELRLALSHIPFENLLSKSFDAYLQTHQKEYQYCPTPDCPTVYKVTSDGSVTTCRTCLALICTTCQTINHDGMTCEDSRYMVTDDYKAFKEWKEKNDVRDCPRCKTGIEKTFGCNHMECGSCKAHICWSCMDFFSTSRECYDHMSAKHGSFYNANHFDAAW